MTLIQITGAATQPVTLAEARLHCRVDATDEDAGITNLIVAATSHAQQVTGLALEQQTWELVLDAFPEGDIVLDLGPVQSVTSITYLDVDGDDQTLAGSDYVVDTASASARLRATAAWPATRDTLNAVRVRFVTGAAVSKDVRQAILMLVAHWFANRETVVVGVSAAEVPMAVTSLLNLRRRMFV